MLLYLPLVRGQDIAPQIWNNANLVWSINDQFLIRSSLAYNVLLSEDFPWYEVTFTTTGAYTFHKNLQGSLGLYLATTKQSLTLSSFEARPFLGFRIFSDVQKRFVISNLNRLELRHFNYSDNTNDLAFRYRNRTDLAYALTKRSMTSSNNLFIFGYFEAFYNFDKEVRERFFTQFKYKLGFGYRLSPSWIFDFGVIYQDAEDNIEKPVQLPTKLTTNYVIDWGVSYIIQ
jgi:hypothetical protein